MYGTDLISFIHPVIHRAWEANTVIDETIFSVYPHLRKKQSELEFGYKISHENLSKEQRTIHVLPLGSRLHP